MTRKIKLSELKRIVKKVVNESRFQNEYFEFQFDDESSFEGDKEENLGFSKVHTCKNGMVWGKVNNPDALQRQASVAVKHLSLGKIAVLMDGDQPKAVAQFNPVDFRLEMVAGAHNQKITSNQDLYDCVLELGEWFGRRQAMELMMKGGKSGFWNP